MKLMKSILGLAAIAATIPYKVENIESEEGKRCTLTSLTWKAEYKSSTETEDSMLSIDLLGGLQETVDTVVSTVKDVFFTKEAEEDAANECDFYDVTEVPCQAACEAVEEVSADAAVETEKEAETMETVETAEAVNDAEISEKSEAAEAVEVPARDAKFDEAVQVALEEGKISTSMLQRKLSIGYSRASKIIAAMEKEGMVAPYDGKNARTVLIGKE